MPLRIPCRARETSTSTGTGDFTLSGALSAILQVLVTAGDGTRVPYYIVDTANGEFERGLGVINDASPDTLQRVQVFESTNAGAKVSFAAGTKDVFIDPHPEMTSGNLIDVVAKTASFTVTAADFATLFDIDSSGGAVTATLPLLADVWLGYTVAFRKSESGNNAITIVEAAGDGAATLDVLGLDGAVVFVTAISATEWVVSSRHAGGVPGQLGAVRVYTAGATWTKPAGLKRAIITVQGAGGGGGYADPSASQHMMGYGGQGGGYARVLIEAASLGATETVTIGAGGAGGVASTTTASTAGGTSSFGSHISCTGGPGGSQAGSGTAAITQRNTSTPGTPTVNTGTALHACAGGYSGPGMRLDGEDGFGGDGGNSILGHGGYGGRSASGDSNAGGNGGGYGAGGGGAAAENNANRNGGAGAGGIVIVEEYF